MYNTEIWIRAGADIRVIVSPLLARSCQAPRDFWTLRAGTLMGMEVLIEKLAIYERTSRLRGRTCIAINRTYIGSPLADVHELYKNTVHHPVRKKKGHDGCARGSKVELFGARRVDRLLQSSGFRSSVTDLGVSCARPKVG